MAPSASKSTGTRCNRIGLPRSPTMSLHWLLGAIAWALVIGSACGATSLDAMDKPLTERMGYGLRFRSNVSEERRAQHRREQEVELTNNSNESSPRVIIFPFVVKLWITPFELGQNDVDQLHSTLEKVIFDYVDFQQRSVDGTRLDFVLLGLIESEYDGGKTTLSLNTGVASFAGTTGIPSESAVNRWVRDAIEADLIVALDDTPFYYIEDVEYVTNDDRFVEGIEEDVPVTTPSSDNGPRLGLLMGAVVAAFAVAALISLYVLRQNSTTKRVVSLTPLGDENNGKDESSQSSLYIERVTGVLPLDDIEEGSNEGDFDIILENERESTGSAPSSAAVFSTPTVSRSGTLEDTASLAESDADWTVNTEAGDSLALKSVSSRPQLALSASIRSTESFEQDRPVSLRKDMLTSPWSGQATIGRPFQGETVLAPSHFTASEERMVRHRVDVLGEDGSDNKPLDDEISDDSVLFSQAHEGAGSNVYLMPPSHARSHSSSSRTKPSIV